MIIYALVLSLSGSVADSQATPANSYMPQDSQTALIAGGAVSAESRAQLGIWEPDDDSCSDAGLTVELGQ